jgi:hypothetical protein
MVGATPECVTAAPRLSVLVSDQGAARVASTAAPVVVAQAEQLLGAGKASDSLSGRSRKPRYGHGSMHDPTFCVLTRPGGSD